MIKSSEIDDSFIEKMRSTGGKTINLCFQCGTCSGICPVGRLVPLRTRRLIRKALLGLKEKAITSEDLWLCMVCYRCYERCPRGVNIPSVILAIRDQAVSMGILPPKGYLEMAKSLLERGIMQVPQEVYTKDFETFDRKTLNLPEFGTKPIDEFSKTLLRTDHHKVLGREPKE